ncbi:probable ATP-dependent RNA helicase spindle-E [Bradysia coprophila]|uniref:probable ATP-dependent RNA helicase spindle-E n=1 Tax=Bradysia coprophila TaxID=38358 RepID=UPI00187D934E|nr:probable ATP-dependent RNA helicase spindle-E [Bradysia coprophila]
MAELNSFFSLKTDIKREPGPSGYVSSRRIPKAEPIQPVKRNFVGTEYGEEERRAELDNMKKFAEFESTAKRRKYQSDEESSNEGASTIATMDRIDDVYNRYDFTRTLPDLPIIEMKDLILETIKANPVVILEGATGCGKSTQVPQFILDDGFKRKKSVNIIVTQPRRIAAISIANRVAKERGLPNLPHLIGYQIGLSVKTNADTRITFCTTGVLLEKLVACGTLSNYTHIILDEVHERSQDMDFLFIVIKKLWLTAPNVRIILMSATIEAAEFAAYFSNYSGGPNNEQKPAPIIKVDKKTNFQVQSFTLDDLSKIIIDKSITFELSNPEMKEEMYLTALRLIIIFDRIDNTDELRLNKKPTILIFLPGYYEIGYMGKLIAEYARILQEDPIVVLLHSMITHEEQARAMKTPPADKRMIILATNIAESSITVPDVKYVIDFCLTKHNIIDTTTNITSLQLAWCSRSSCRQRAGRTGRTMNGRVYRLVPKDFYENQMDETSKPEMVRCPLEKVVLKAKQLNMGSPCTVIAWAMDRPTKYDIENTILLLKEAGAMLRTAEGHHSDDDGDITLIGHVMTALPVDFLIAKLIVLGFCFNVLSECIIIGAGLTTKSIFQQGTKNVVRFYSKKMVWSDGSGSDLFAILKAYNAYADRIKKQQEIKNWADRYYLNERSLSEMSDLIKDIKERLDRFGIKDNEETNRTNWTSTEKSLILKVVIAGAFYPNYFVHSSSEMEQREISRVLNGRDPSNTVYFTGFPEKYIRPLYVKSITKLMSPCTNLRENIQVSFDEGTEKVFVSFNQTRMSIEANTDADLNVVEMGPEETCIEVYKALKLKKSSKQLVLRVMHPFDAQKFAEEMGVGSLVQGKWICKKKTIENIEMLCLPRKDVRRVKGKITHYDTNFNRFWFRSSEEEKYFRVIQSELNSSKDIEEFQTYDDIEIGQVVAAFYDGVYNRAKVLLAIEGADTVLYHVMLLDIGSDVMVEFSELRRLRGVSAQYTDIPPRVFECRLAFIQPSEMHSHRYEWQSIMAEFQKLISDEITTVEIYSVERGVASVSIYIDDQTVQNFLIGEGFARATDENFMSKLDHDQRIKKQKEIGGRYDDECDAMEEEMRKMMPIEEACETEEPNMSTRHITVTLNGPKSPLECELSSSLHQSKYQSKHVIVDTHSVNSILLKANPQDTFEKYVVAASVTQSQRESKLTVHETSLMPSIPGFGPLMALLFSPYCEFFRDSYKSRYTAILCGLGEHPSTKQPIYGEHDAVFNLDVEIDSTDIETINRCRVIMDTFLQMKPDQKQPKVMEWNRHDLTSKIKTEILSLLEKQRPLMGISYNSDMRWSKYHPNDLIRAKSVFPLTAIFPTHNILSLAAADSPDRLYYHHDLVENNKELHQTSKSDVALRRPVNCRLCLMELDTVADLKIHLYSRLHSEREKKILSGH